METTLSAMAGLVGGIVIGLAAALIALRVPNEYAGWLGKDCWVRPVSRPSWRRHVVVAVSWKGAVCVRRADRLDEDGYWIKKHNVSWRVRFDEPEPLPEPGGAQ